MSTLQIIRSAFKLKGGTVYFASVEGNTVTCRFCGKRWYYSNPTDDGEYWTRFHIDITYHIGYEHGVPL